MEQTKREPVVLVAFDDSKAGAAVLDGALAAAKDAGWPTLHVANVFGAFDPMSRMEYAYEMHRLDLDAEREKLEARAAQAAARVEGAPDLQVHVLVGPPAKEILGLAAKLDADLLIVGTHGRKGIGRVVLGSVAEEILRNARCPVLVMRGKTWQG